MDGVIKGNSLDGRGKDDGGFRGKMAGAALSAAFKGCASIMTGPAIFSFLKGFHCEIAIFCSAALLHGKNIFMAAITG